VWRWDQQEPFGNNPADENPSGLGAFEFDLRFPGQVWSKETQTSYNSHRDAYDPATGRYPQSDPIGLEGAWSKIYAYRPRYLDVRAGRYVPEHPDRMNDARFMLVQGSMVFRHPVFASAVPMAQEFNTYAYANLDPIGNFDVSGLQSESLLETPKGGGPSAWSSPTSQYEQCVAQACVAGTIAGVVVGRSVVGAGVGFVGGFFLGGYFCPGDPINLTLGTSPGKTSPSAPPKN
jgi:RHS repeat-associated protein